MTRRSRARGAAAGPTGRLLAVIAGSLALAFILGPTSVIGAGAQIQVSPSQPVPGQQVTVRGSGFCPGPCSAVTVTVDGAVAADHVAVSAGGTFEVAVALTPVAGSSMIIAFQTQPDGAIRQATATVHVVASDPIVTPSPGPTGTPAAPSATPAGPTASPSAAPTGTPGTAESTAQIHVFPDRPVPGQRVLVVGSGFCPSPCSAVQISVDGAVAAGAVAVAVDGTFEIEIGLIPVAGTATIVASQTENAGAVRQATAIVHVVASDQVGPSPTPIGGPTATAAPGGREPESGAIGTGALVLAVVAVVVAVAAAAIVARRRSRGSGPA